VAHLKRTLNHGKLEIQPVDVFSLQHGRAEARADRRHAKIILIGDRDMYELLYDFEDDFKKIFKVRVEFDEEMKWSEEVLRQYGGRLRKLSDDEKLLPFDRTAVAAILEHGVRLAGRRGKSPRDFSISPIWRANPPMPPAQRHPGDHGRARERSARREGRAPQPARNENPRDDRAEPAVHRHHRRAHRPGERLERAGNRRLRFRQTRAHHRIGRPRQERHHQYRARIESQRPISRQGRADHFRLFIRRTFAQDKPLSLSASLCFEQSYSGVDGDSASSTEIYALLSALSEVCRFARNSP
jgi:hypothetical protein